MFGIETNVLIFTLLAGVSAAGLAYAFLFTRLSEEARRDKRIKSVNTRNIAQQAATQAKMTDASKRRKSVQESVKELEAKQKQSARDRLTLKKILQQAGMNITVPQFFMFSFVFGVLFAFVALLLGAGLYMSLAALAVGTFGVPRWFVGRRRKKRLNKFIEEFPNAVDVIVRGVKAGLPLNDCMAMVGQEAKEPVASEFRKIIEVQQFGVPVSEAVTKLYDNVPLAEANFFGIVVSIQQSAGGNLSEALGNLSGVLRDRKKMKAKIQAMSAEAKASGMIIGALPVVVGVLVYFTTPDYIKILFTDPTGNLILGASAIWMGAGIFVMKKMISFDF